MSAYSDIRQQANRAILELLAAEVEKYPDQRFGQILVNLGVLQREKTRIYSPTDWDTEVRDHFHEESTATLSRMEVYARRQG